MVSEEEIDRALKNSSKRVADYRESEEVRLLEIEHIVIDRLLDQRLLIKE